MGLFELKLTGDDRLSCCSGEVGKRSGLVLQESENREPTWIKGYLLVSRRLSKASWRRLHDSGD